MRVCGCSTTRPHDSDDGNPAPARRGRPPAIVAGRERASTSVAALVDTNLLVYRFDPRFPEKQEIATAILRRGIEEDSIRVPHQAIVEFVAAVSRPLSHGAALLSPEEARRE